MRIWDRIHPHKLCRQHLLGEHREIHGLLRVLAKLDAGERAGYALHPEVRRWLPRQYRVALWRRHGALAAEMIKRGYQHNSPVLGPGEPGEWITRWPLPLDDQIAVLFAKGCDCMVGGKHHPDKTYALADLERHCLADVRYATEAERCAAYRSLQATAGGEADPDKDEAWLEEKRDHYAEAHGL